VQIFGLTEIRLKIIQLLVLIEGIMSIFSQIISEELALETHQWLLMRIEPKLVKFQQEIKDCYTNYQIIVSSTIPNLLGIGEGSTPESDDLFLGVIATIICKNPSFSEFFNRLTTMKFEDYTTRRSSLLIRRFLRENYPKEIRSFIALLKSESYSSSYLSKLKLEIQKIKRIGASSGYFFLVGVHWQLEYYEKQNQILIANIQTEQD